MAEKRGAAPGRARGAPRSARLAVRRLTQSLRGNGRRVVAALLVLALCYESLFTSGVTLALADALASGGPDGTTTGAVVSPGESTGDPENATGGLPGKNPPLTGPRR